MNSYYELASESVNNTVTLVPEQTMFALALSANQKYRSRSDVQNTIRQCVEFIDTLHKVVVQDSKYSPDTNMAASISAGVRRLPPTSLEALDSELQSVQPVLKAILAGSDVGPDDIASGCQRLGKFADFVTSHRVGLRETDSDNRSLLE